MCWKVGVATVTESNLSPNSVGTPELVDQAVTLNKVKKRLVVDSTAGAGDVARVVVSGNTVGTPAGTYKQLAAATLTTTGRPVFVNIGGGTFSLYDGDNQLRAFNCYVQLTRVDTSNNQSATLTETVVAINAAQALQVPGTITIIDVPPVGTYSYRVSIKLEGGGANSSAGATGALTVFEF